MRLAIVLAVSLGMLQGCAQIASLPAEPDASVPRGWTLIPAGTTNLNSVSGVSDKAVWVVGDRGVIGRWDGTKLTWESSGTTANLHGVWALDAEDAYAVGDGGTILQRTASGWQSVGAKLTRQVMTGVWADTTRVVAVGSNGTVILGGATGYKVLNNPTPQNLFGVTGTPGGSVSIVGAIGLLLELNGTTLTRTKLYNPPPGSSLFTKLLSGAGSGPNGTYYVGQQGTVYVADATGVNPVPGCPAAALRSVSSAGASAWAVGWDGTICELAGATTTSFPYTDGRWLNGVYAASPTSLWVVGASGTLLHGLPIATDAGTPDATAPQDNL